MITDSLHLKDQFPFLGEDGRDPKVDLYLPTNFSEFNHTGTKRPCMIVCPGGGYCCCSQREAEPIALHFLPEGYNVFVLWYSVAPHRFPCQLREVAAVMELIYQNAEEWHCDTEKVAIIGFSAGGHLAAHYSTAFDCAEVREVFPESKAVNASVLSYPVITADMKNAHLGSFQNLLGKQELSAEDVEKFSCEKLVRDITPPAFLWHTAEDNTVPVANSLIYAQALAEHKIPIELHIYPHGYHGLSTVDKQTNDELSPEMARTKEWLYNVKNWLNTIFK